MERKSEESLLSRQKTLRRCKVREEGMEVNKEEQQIETTSKDSKVQGRGLSGENSSVTITNKPPKKSHYEIIKLVGNTNTYINDDSNAQVAAAGVQNTACYVHLNKVGDMLDAINKTAVF